jgi:hypothetical protein
MYDAFFCTVRFKCLPSHTLIRGRFVLSGLAIKATLVLQQALNSLIHLSPILSYSLRPCVDLLSSRSHNLFCHLSRPFLRTII